MRETDREGCEAFLTNIKGRIVGHILVFAAEDALWLDSVPGSATFLASHLDRYVITEDVQVLEIEATRQMPSDSAARQAWYETATTIRNETGATPHCLSVAGPGFGLYVVEFDRGGDWRLVVTYAPSLRLRNRQELSARTAVAVRRFSLRERFPQAGQPNPDSLPTWTDEPEECKLP